MSSDKQRSKQNASFGFYNGNRYGQHGDIRIMSAFQAIYSIAHRRIVGLEGLARGIDQDSNSVSAAQLFTSKNSQDISKISML